MSRRPDGARPEEARLCELPVPSSPLVAFRMQIATGAIDDPEGRAGLNTLTALTISEGGTRDRTYKQVLDQLYPMAASIYAQPDREVTTFVGQAHRDHIQEFQGLLADLLTRPRFDPADFERGRDLLLAAIETTLRSQDDEELGKEALQARLYAGHPYRHPVVGTVRGLKSLTLDDVRAHYATHYRRGALLVGVAGGYPEGFPARMREAMGALPEGGASRPPLPQAPAVHGLDLLLVEKPGPTTAISIGAPIGVTRADPDFFPLMLANSRFGEHRTFNGRLINAMRAARGLNYGDYSYIETFLQEGGSSLPVANIPRRQQAFSIWIRPVARENAAFALRQALYELRRLVDEGLTPEEFEETRRYLLNASRLWTQSLSRRLGYAMDALFYGRRDLVTEVQEALPKLDVSQVNAAVRKHLHPIHLKAAIVTGDARALAEELASGRPTPIVYQTPTADPHLLREDEAIARFPLSLRGEIPIVPAREMFES